MSQVIWKYKLESVEQDLMMPDGSEVLSVGIQHREMFIWAIGDPNKDKVQRTFHVLGTGHNCIRKLSKCLGRVDVDEGTFIFHVFEVLS